MSVRVLRLLAASLFPTAVSAQSLDLTIDHTGLSIGDSRFVRGVRINFRDRNLELVQGVNITVWSPYEPARGVVQGLALGVPVTGAKRIEGVGVGIFGVGTTEEFSGIGIGGFGVGSGGDARGALIGGFGVGSGHNVTGLTIGGFGAGAGGDVTGIQIGGFGVGAGGRVTGISIGGFGAGAGGDLKGLTIGGFGAGSGGDITGITIGGFGTGAGGDIRGITIGGFGAGAGGTLEGLVIGGFGAGAPRIRAIVLTGVGAGGLDVEGGVLAPLYFKIEEGGRVSGITISSFNHVKGDQFGLSLGLLNYAWNLHGVQIGVLNYAKNNPRGLRLLPIFNKRW